MSDEKDLLARYLTKARSDLVAKLDGLDERQIRWPMTATGTNLLGILKHVASVELGYLGDVMGRPSGIALPWYDVLDKQARIAQRGTPAQILAAPADDFVRRFIGADGGERELRVVEQAGGRAVVVDELQRPLGVLAP